MKMFHTARIKLTAWYLVIIMAISLSFSTIIFFGFGREVDRGFRRLELILKAKELDIPLPRQIPSGPLGKIDPRLEELGKELVFDQVHLTQMRLGNHLIILNLVILATSSIASYFLAGKTLKPIEVAMEEQKRFVSDASHELKTPLTALKTSIEVALRQKKMSPKEAEEILRSNLEEIDNLSLLSNNLLKLSQYQQGNGNLNFKSTNIKKMIEAAKNKITPLAKEKNIDIKADLKRQSAEVEKESLENMILILLDNAIKYTPKRGLVEITNKRVGKNLIISVKDNGMGIKKKDLPHIFDRFYRVDQSRNKSKVPGFGLGLSLAKKIVEIHKGTITVNSKPKEGTTFTIKLPTKHN